MKQDRNIRAKSDENVIVESLSNSINDKYLLMYEVKLQAWLSFDQLRVCEHHDFTNWTDKNPPSLGQPPATPKSYLFYQMSSHQFGFNPFTYVLIKIWSMDITP